MAIFDIIFVVLAGLILFSYARRGFIGSIFHFAKTYLAFFFAYTFGGAIGESLEAAMSDSPDFIRTAVGYVVAFVVALLVLSIVVFFLNKLISQVKLLKSLNGFLGTLLGILVAFAFLLVITSIFRTFFAGEAIYEETVVLKWIGESGLLETFKFFDVASALSF